MQSERILEIVLDTPLERVFDYMWSGEILPVPGQFALLNFGRREMVGLIVGVKDSSDVPRDKLKSVIAVREQLLPVSAQWIALCQFAADYYQRPLGEVALPAIPKNCRASKTTALDKALKKLTQPLKPVNPSVPPLLNDTQQTAVHKIVQAKGYAANLLRTIISVRWVKLPCRRFPKAVGLRKLLRWTRRSKSWRNP